MSFSEEKRKKLIVPAVALMMCAVAMIGVGYAAVTSSVTNTGNTLEKVSLSVDLYDNGTATNSTIFSAGSIKYGTIKESQTSDYSYVVDSEPITISKNNTQIKCISESSDSLPTFSKAFVKCSYTTTGGNLQINTVSVTINSDTKNVSGEGTGYWELNTNQLYSVVITVSFSDSEMEDIPVPPTFDLTFTAYENNPSP